MNEEHQATVQKILMQKLPEVEAMKSSEPVARDLPNKSSVLHEFLLVVFIKCVVLEAEMHDYYETNSKA